MASQDNDEQPILPESLIQLGDEYDSYDEFQRILDRYSDLTYTDFVTNISASVNDYNPLVNKALKFARKRLSCIHGGKHHVSRSKGIRKVTTRKTGCPVRIVLHSTKDRQRLYVSEITLGPHNHPIDEVQYKLRHLGDETDAEIYKLVSMHDNKTLARHLIHDRLSRELDRDISKEHMRVLWSRLNGKFSKKKLEKLSQKAKSETASKTIDGSEEDDGFLVELEDVVDDLHTQAPDDSENASTPGAISSAKIGQAKSQNANGSITKAKTFQLVLSSVSKVEAPPVQTHNSDNDNTTACSSSSLDELFESHKLSFMKALNPATITHPDTAPSQVRGKKNSPLKTTNNQRNGQITVQLRSASKKRKLEVEKFEEVEEVGEEEEEEESYPCEPLAFSGASPSQMKRLLEIEERKLAIQEELLVLEREKAKSITLQEKLLQEGQKQTALLEAFLKHLGQGEKSTQVPGDRNKKS